MLWPNHMFTVSFYFADISPERKGNGGESIYGPTFEGKKTYKTVQDIRITMKTRGSCVYISGFTCIVCNMSF